MEYILEKISSIDLKEPLNQILQSKRINFHVYLRRTTMNHVEYDKINNLNYIEYCDYLQQKHGIGKYNYMTSTWNKNSRSSRTSEGLIAHHKYEDTVVMLSNKNIAMMYPFEWQEKQNLIYCNYLEHLLLHVLICEHPSIDRPPNMNVGIGGVINFIAPELNDVYSGFITNQKWRETCYSKIIDHKDVYLLILKRFKESAKNNPSYTENCLFRSYNEKHGLWDSKKNIKIYNEIYSL